MLQFFNQKKIKIASIVLSFCLLFSLLFIYSINVRGNCFYGDDLLDYNDYLKFNFFEFIFKRTQNYLRPISFAAIYISDSLFDIDYRLSIFFNILLFVFALFALFLICNKITKNKVYISLFVVFIYAFSFLNYYHIAYVLGAMESLSLLFLFLIVYFVICFKETSKKINAYCSFICFIFLFLNCERFFFVCLPLSLSLFFLCNNKKDKIVFSALPLLILLILFIIKTPILKIPFIKQTAGGDVHFNLNEIISQGLKTLIGIFQIPWNFQIFERMGVIFKIFTILSGCIIFILFTLSIHFFVRNIINKKYAVLIDSSFLLFFVLNFGMLCLTKNVLSRMLSAPYAVVLLFIISEFNFNYDNSYDSFELLRPKKKKNVFIFASIFFVFVLNDVGVVKKNNSYYDWGIKGKTLYNEAVLPFKEDYKNKPLMIFATTYTLNYPFFKAYWIQFQFPKGYSLFDLTEKDKKIGEMTIEERNHTVMITVDNNFKCERIY